MPLGIHISPIRFKNPTFVFTFTFNANLVSFVGRWIENRNVRHVPETLQSQMIDSPFQFAMQFKTANWKSSNTLTNLHMQSRPDAKNNWQKREINRP